MDIVIQGLAPVQLFHNGVCLSETSILPITPSPDGSEIIQTSWSLVMETTTIAIMPNIHICRMEVLKSIWRLQRQIFVNLPTQNWWLYIPFPNRNFRPHRLVQIQTPFSRTVAQMKMKLQSGSGKSNWIMKS